MTNNTRPMTAGTEYIQCWSNLVGSIAEEGWMHLFISLHEKPNGCHVKRLQYILKAHYLEEWRWWNDWCPKREGRVLSGANRKKIAVKASTVKERVLPNPLVSTASSVPMQEPISTTVDNVVHSLPSVECRSSRVWILKRGFKSRKHNINVVDIQDKNAGTFVQEPLAAAVSETEVPNVDRDFVDSIPAPPTVEDTDANVVDNRRRNPKRKGRPNEFVMREQVECNSEDEEEVDCASPQSSDASSSSDDGSVLIRSKSSLRSKKVCTT